MEGWIKIHRSIIDHWIFKKSTWLYWWIDMLLMAAWEDRKQLVGNQLIVLRRGQLIASMSYLCKRWKHSRTMIEPYLNLLQEDGMISKEVDKNVSIITIKNYARYQAMDDAYLDAHLNESDSYSYEQQDAHLNAYLDTHLDAYIHATNKEEEKKEYKEENILSKDNIKEEREERKPSKAFRRPTVQQVEEYCQERNNSIDAQSFVDFYDSKGWVVGKSPMKDWKAAVRTWEKKRERDDKPKGMDVGVILKERPKYTKGW